ncbi:uncharacterized protein LOC129590681 [Paramacrobiotus metropolitanus]|uniref:uncharacterized protein LOC129590681 n=1 Tax=Paramacrobiotus metropolitanus TaxID=2943436 RepID=UPI0024458600|nr:uncharacterized protein LOC129590681 [Paramacrobiotus metropolitanus]
MNMILFLLRVCALWQQLLSSRRATEQIRICLETCSKESKSDNFNCIKGAYLLSRTVSSATKSLAIRKRFFNDLYLYSLLNSMQIKLPILVFEDYAFTEPNSLTMFPNATRIPIFSGSRDMRFFVCFGATIWLTIYQDTSKCIVLHNWKLSNIFGLALTQSFNSRYNVFPLVPLPAHEVKWMKPPTQESEIHVLEIDKIQVTIPKLVFDCSNDLVSMVCRFMWALDDNFPPVAEDVYAHVKSVHARWVQTIAYPHEWETIRAFLSVFSGFHADGTPRLWMETDLRLLDVCKPSRMALLGIGELFRA